MTRRFAADAEYETCPNCGNHVAEVFRRKEERSTWLCHGCGATGRFWPDGKLALVSRPAR